MLAFIISISSINAFAATVTQDNLEVTLVTDKEKYAEDEQIKATLTVQNNNKVPVTNVDLETALPDGYKLADKSESKKTVDSIAAGESVSLDVTLEKDNTKKESTPSEPSTDAKSSTNPVSGGNSGTTTGSTTTNGSAIQTGQNLLMFGIVSLIVLFSVFVFVFFFKKNNSIKGKSKNLLSIILCTSILLATIFFTPISSHAAENNIKEIDIEHNITVNNTKLKLNSLVKYVINYNEGQDTDGDGASDLVESLIGSDPTKIDTDNDGLTDYQEIFLTGTDPILYDTDGDGLNDGESDTDKDKLSNLKEISIKTDPMMEDSDGDKLSDLEEINRGTNPLSNDTDGDGALDGWEVTNGYDPLVFNLSFDVEKTSTDENLTVTVKTTVSGSNTESLTAEPSTNELLDQNVPGYIGKAYDFSVGGEFEEANISFTFDENLLSDSGFIPVIYYYNEDSQSLEEMETHVNGNVASTTVTHFSTYILLNKANFDKVWENEIKPPQTENPDETLDIVFVIDYSASMYDNDPTKLCTSLSKEFVSKLRDDKDMSAVVKFIRRATMVTNLTMNKDEVYTALDSISYDSGYNTYSGTDGSAGLKTALDIFDSSTATYKYIIFLTDGEDNGYSYSYDSLITRANNNDVTIYSVGMGSASTSVLRNVSEKTNGKFYYAYNADSLTDIYNQVAIETVDYSADSNNDGISDYYTKLLCDGTLKLGTGRDNPFYFGGYSYEEVQSNSDLDGDGLSNGEELLITTLGSRVYVNMYSDPTNQDSDYDGVPDNSDYKRLNNSFDGKMTGYYDISNADYTLNYLDFYNDNTDFSKSLCSASLIFSNTIYSDTSFIYNTESNTISGIKEMMEYHGFKNVIDYKLSEGYNNDGISVEKYSDDDISEIGIGYHPVSYNGESKTVLGVIIRGTNGTIEEWSSNFDMGDPSNWKSDYHKGFLLTEQRIKSFVEKYTQKYISDSSNLIYWVTGHSRGAALANILAAHLVDSGKTVYAYTFATPSTTISLTKNASKYNCIFNYANTSDFVTYVPLEQWGFGRFGITKSLSIEDSGLNNIWKQQTGNSNNYNALNKSVIKLATDRITKSCSKSWNEVFTLAGSQNINDNQLACISNRAKRYCDITERTFWGRHTGYKLYPSTAFVFQLGAEILAGSDLEKDNAITIIKELWNSKYGGVIVLFLGDSLMNLDSFKNLSIGESLIGDGHAPATYYVLTKYE